MCVCLCVHVCACVCVCMCVIISTRITSDTWSWGCLAKNISISCACRESLIADIESAVHLWLKLSNSYTGCGREWPSNIFAVPWCTHNLKENNIVNTDMQSVGMYTVLQETFEGENFRKFCGSVASYSRKLFPWKYQFVKVFSLEIFPLYGISENCSHPYWQRLELSITCSTEKWYWNAGRGLRTRLSTHIFKQEHIRMWV